MKTTAAVSLAAALTLAATAALAGTKIVGTIAPVPSDCNTGPGFCKNGLAHAGDCGLDNSLCTGATLMKAKLKFKDNLELKVTVKNLLDNDGALVSTDTGNALDDHVLKLTVNRCIVDNGAPSHCANPLSIFVKLDFDNGKATVVADLTQVFAADPSLTAIGLTGASLSASMANAANCPGTNSAGDIATRVNDADCDGGLPYGLYGIVKP